MTKSDLTVINKNDLFSLFDIVDQLRSLGLACRAFTILLDPHDQMHPLLDLMFDQVDRQTEELSEFAEQIKIRLNR